MNRLVRLPLSRLRATPIAGANTQCSPSGNSTPPFMPSSASQKLSVAAFSTSSVRRCLPNAAMTNGSTPIPLALCATGGGVVARASGEGAGAGAGGGAGASAAGGVTGCVRAAGGGVAGGAVVVIGAVLTSDRLPHAFRYHERIRGRPALHGESIPLEG